MKRQTIEEYVRERIKQKGEVTANEAKPGKPKQEPEKRSADLKYFLYMNIAIDPNFGEEEEE